VVQPHLPAEALIPEQLTIESLRAAAAGCKACDLWKIGTQTVFGEGKENARLMLVGEQPGDHEDVVLATVHPSSVLRSPDEKTRKDAMEELIADLKAASRHLRSGR
jgi:uracil-DNA glycosylase